MAEVSHLHFPWVSAAMCTKEQRWEEGHGWKPHWRFPAAVLDGEERRNFYHWFLIHPLAQGTGGAGAKKNEALSMQVCFLAEQPTVKEYSMTLCTLSRLANTFVASNGASNLQQPPPQQISCDIKKKNNLAVWKWSYLAIFPEARDLIL